VTERLVATRWDKKAAKVIVDSGALALLERLEWRRPRMLRILAYHRIGSVDHERSYLDPTLITASPLQFRQQMEFLAENYYVVSLDELLSSLASRSALPPRSVLITFDDGYRDFLDVAWPVLARLRLPAVLFVATDYLSQARPWYWWDRLWLACTSTEHEELVLGQVGRWPLRTREERIAAFRELKSMVVQLENDRALALVDEIIAAIGAVNGARSDVLLTWDDVRRLSRAGAYIGAHTCSHPILSRISLEQARAEIVGSQTALESELGHVWPVFAYPRGHASDIGDGVRKIVAAEGFAVAVTMISGHNRIGWSNPLSLRRIGMAPHVSLDEFRLALTFAYDLYAYDLYGSVEQGRSEWRRSRRPSLL